MSTWIKKIESQSQMIAAMEQVFQTLGEIADVEPGDIEGLVDWANQAKAALSEQEPVAWLVESDFGVMVATREKHFAESIRCEGRKIEPLFTHPQPQKGDVSRDDVIQCIFATHKQSEGVMADAILSLFNQPTAQEDGQLARDSFYKAWKSTYATDEPSKPTARGVESKVPQSVEEFKGWYCAHCHRGVDATEVTFSEQHEVCGRVITDDTPPSFMAGKALVPVEPTDIILEAGYSYHYRLETTLGHELAVECYKAMLEAAKVE